VSGMARASYNIPEDVMFRDAARTVLLSAFEQMAQNAEGTRRGLERREPTEVDIEYLHDMRVGSRRLRAALSVYGSIFSKDDLRYLDRAVGSVTDALALVRDLDVQIDEFRKTRATLPENEAYGVGRLVERRLKARDRDRKKLLVRLEEFDTEKFGKRFRKLLDKSAPEHATENVSMAKNLENSSTETPELTEKESENG